MIFSHSRLVLVESLASGGVIVMKNEECHSRARPKVFTPLETRGEQVECVSI